MGTIRKNDVIQFKDNHKYNGCLGIVEKTEYRNRKKIYQIMVPIPDCNNGDMECGGYRVSASIDEIAKVGKVVC